TPFSIGSPTIGMMCAPVNARGRSWAYAGVASASSRKRRGSDRLIDAPPAWVSVAPAWMCKTVVAAGWRAARSVQSAGYVVYSAPACEDVSSEVSITGHRYGCEAFHLCAHLRL